MANEFLKDCLKKLRDAGSSIDLKDERIINEYIEQGMEPMAAVRRRFIERSKNVIDILDQARQRGAKIKPVQDTLDDIISRRSTVLARQMQAYKDERDRVGVELGGVNERLEQINDQITMLEIYARSTGVETEFPPEMQSEVVRRRTLGFSLAFASSEDMQRVFEIMQFQDRVRVRSGGQALAVILELDGKTPAEMYEAYKAKLKERLEVHQRRHDLEMKLRMMERRMDTIISGETRNPDFGLDANGNYVVDPGDPDGVAERIVDYYRGYRGEHGAPTDELVQTRYPTIAFAEDKETANLYATQPNNRADTAVAPRVMVADLDIQNPVKTDGTDPFFDFEQIVEMVGMDAALELARDSDFSDSVMGTDGFEEFRQNLPKDERDEFDELSLDQVVQKYPDSLASIYGNAFFALQSRPFVEALKAAGYDGAIIGGSGENAGMLEYHVFSPDQIKAPGVREEIFNVSYSSEAPWTIKTSGDGDLYIRRHGPNAGQVFKERQGPNDFAISFNKSLLLPEYMYYVLQFVQPQIAARARGTAQQAIRKSDIDTVIKEFFERQAREPVPPSFIPPTGGKGDLIADPNIPADRRQRESVANYKAVVKLVEEGSFTVGIDTVNDAADAAHVLAEIRKNAQEGFWGVVLDENNKILGIVNHSKGGVDGTSVYPAVIAGHVYQIPGARKVWWGHNHPSGTLEASQADQRITQTMENLMRGGDVEIMGHVIVANGRDRFAQMGNGGIPTGYSSPIRPAARNRKVPVYTRRIQGARQVGATVRSPGDMLNALRDIFPGGGVQEGVLFLNNRHEIVGFLEMTADEMKRLRGTGNLTRILKAQSEMNAAAIVSLTNEYDVDAQVNIAALAQAASSTLRHLDHMYKQSGAWVSTQTRLEYQEARRTFNQDIVGLTSGLLEAAKNLPQNKGPADQMLNLLRKQPGVKKEEMDAIELEDWLGAKKYVTKDELINYIDKNGVVVEEFWFTEEGRNRGRESVGLNTQELDPYNPMLREAYADFGGISQEAIDWIEQEEAWRDAIDNPRVHRMIAVTATDTGRHFLLLEAFAGQGPAQISYTRIYDMDQKSLLIDDPENVRVLGDGLREIQTLTLNETALVRGGLESMMQRLRQQRQTIWDIRGKPRYTDYTLPGGSNHREVVFRLPPEANGPKRIAGTVVGPAGFDLDLIIDHMNEHSVLGPISDPDYLQNAQDGEAYWSRDEEMGLIEFSDFSTEQWEALDDIVSSYADQGLALNKTAETGSSDAPLYTESHAYNNWNNILMWARLNERIGPNGERILFVEEIQSDWHQSGREYGYRDDAYEREQARIERERKTAVLNDRTRAARPAMEILEARWGETVDQIINRVPGEETEEQAELRRTWANYAVVESVVSVIKYRSDWPMVLRDLLGQEWFLQNMTPEHIESLRQMRFASLELETLIRNQQEEQRRRHLSPPDAPFKGSGWAELAIKRMIRLAAEEGFDQVAWTTGDQQNDRWNLRNVTNFINWNPVTRELTAQGFNEYVEADELERYVGKQIAEELIERGRRVEGFEVMAASQADITYRDIQDYFGVYGEDQWVVGIPDEEEFYVEKTIDASEPAHGWVILDENGEIRRDINGTVLWAASYYDARALYNEQVANDYWDPVEGDDLSVGGAGMRKFYDEILVNVANKSIKKLDKKAPKVQKFGGTILAHDPDEITYWENVLDEVTREKQAAIENRHDFETIAYWDGQIDQAYVRLARLRENGAKQVHSFDITEDMMDAALKGQTLFQTKSSRRGSITFDQQNRAIIRMTRARDLSTFLHESGHLYLELLGDMALMPGASDQVRNDYNKILVFLGVEDRSQIRREHHEKFARAFEAYLREGKAPDPGLRNIFHAFSAWLHQIYKQLRQLDVQLTPEIRGVFDRMIATDTAIRQAERVQNFVELFTTADDMGISPEAFDVYRRNAAEAHDEASMREQRRVLGDMFREAQAWWRDERQKVEEEVRQEAYAMRVYRALAMLQRGKNPDGSEVTSAPFKIDKASLMRLLAHSQETLNRLPRPYIYTTKNGVDVELAAKQFGYPNATTMLEEIMRSVPIDKFIQQETDARMAERFPDPLVDGSLQEEAMDLVHNDKRAQVMAAEMRAIRKKIQQDRPIVEAGKKAERRERLAAKQQLPKRGELALIKEAARRTIAQMKVRDVQPHVYLAAEQKAGRKAFEALEKKDFEAAYKYKRQQIVNHEMYRAAQDARLAAEKHRQYLSGFAKKALRQRMGKGGVLERIDALLEEFDFRKIGMAQVDRIKAQTALLEAIDEGQIVAPESLVEKLRASTGRGMSYLELTNEELQGLRDVVRQLEKQGRAQFEAYVMGEKKNIRDSAARLADDLRSTGKVMPIQIGSETLGAAASRNTKSAFYNILRPGALARLLDGSEYGSFTETLIEPIRRAYTEKMLPWFANMEEQVAQIYRKHYDDADLRALNNQRVYINGLRQELTRADMLSIALNWGNEGNRKALIGGKHPITKEQVYSENTVREVLGKLTERDWLFVQEMWDYIGSHYHDLKDENGNVIREGIATVEKRRRGIAPKQVEPLAFTVRTADGKEVSLRGGYYPLRYDRRFSKKQRLQEFDDAMKKMTTGGFARAQTRAGATFERVENHGKVIKLGLGAIDVHLREVLRDIAIGDEVNFVKRVLDDVNLDNAFQETGNNEAMIQLNRWLADSAIGEIPASGLPDQVFAYVRTGFTKAKLGWNMTTMFLQVTGFAQTMAVIGTAKYMRGVGKYAASPVESWKFIMESSAFMRQRYVTGGWNKDVMDTRAHIEAFPIFGVGPTMSRRLTNKFAKTLFAPIMAMQSQVDATTWMAVYIDEVNNGTDPKKAVLVADAMVEKAQTSGFFSDRSALERGTISEKTVQAQLVRIWTTLISYMMAKFGIAVEKTVEAKRSLAKGEFGFGDAIKFAMDMLMLFTVEGIMTALIRGTMPDWEDDEDETMLGWTAKVTAESVLSGIPFVRESLAMQYGGGNTPIGGLARDSVNLYTQALVQREADEALFKALNNVGGTLFHYPSTQTNRIIETAWAEFVEDEDRPALEYLTGRRGE